MTTLVVWRELSCRNAITFSQNNFFLIKTNTDRQLLVINSLHSRT